MWNISFKLLGKPNTAQQSINHVLMVGMVALRSSEQKL